MCGDDSKESVLLILNWWEWEPTYCVEGKDGGSDKTPMQVKIEYPPPTRKYSLETVFVICQMVQE